jgi:short-subunit dehydrogenase
LVQKSNAKVILSSRNGQQLYEVAESAGLTVSRYAVIPLDLKNYKEMPEIAAKAVAALEK